MKVKKSSEFVEYIEKNNLVDVVPVVENLLIDYFKQNPRYHLEEMWMSVYHDPEIDDYLQPQISVVFPCKETIGVDIMIALDIEDFVKKKLAKQSDDVEEFKRKVMRWREFRVIFQAKPLGGRTPTEEDKKVWDEFNKREKWIDEQKEKYGGEIIAYLDENGEFKLIAHSSNEIDLFEGIEKYMEDNGISKDEGIKCCFR